MARALIDQRGRKLHLLSIPRRIVSLCPSTTETLFALGSGGTIVGRTDYCRHPIDKVAALPSVGGTKTVDERRLRALAPDLVVSVREENDEAQIEALGRDLPILILDPVDVETALAGIRLLGAALVCEDRAEALVDEIVSAFSTLPRMDGCRALYLIWRKPFMAAGSGTYINDVMTRLGFQNIAGGGERYPAINAPALAANPHLVFAASEPFPFAEKHLPELHRLMPEAHIVQVNGEMFGWHGARMRLAADYFRQHLPSWKAAMGHRLGPRRHGQAR